MPKAGTRIASRIAFFRRQREARFFTHAKTQESVTPPSSSTSLFVRPLSWGEKFLAACTAALGSANAAIAETVLSFYNGVAPGGTSHCGSIDYNCAQGYVLNATAAAEGITQVLYTWYRDVGCAIDPRDCTLVNNQLIKHCLSPENIVDYLNQTLAAGADKTVPNALCELTSRTINGYAGTIGITNVAPLSDLCGQIQTNVRSLYQYCATGGLWDGLTPLQKGLVAGAVVLTAILGVAGGSVYYRQRYNSCTLV